MSREIVPHFTDDELKCKCHKKECLELPELTQQVMSFLRKISALRDIAGPLTVNSFYRCPLHPLYRAESAHSLGLAIDLSPGKIDVKRLYIEAEKMGFRGIGISEIGISFAQFVHVDMRPGRIARWRYKPGGGEDYFLAFNVEKRT